MNIPIEWQLTMFASQAQPCPKKKKKKIIIYSKERTEHLPFYTQEPG